MFATATRSPPSSKSAFTMRSVLSWRYLRFAPVILILWALLGAVRIGRNQSRFQTFLQTQTIQWDDFPASFADLLRTRDEPAIRAMNVSEVFPETQIPPIIHFIWFQNLYNVDPTVSEIPSLGSNVPDLCREYNPTYTVNVWNATSSRQLLEEHYPWFLNTYDNYAHPIQRVDAIKYFVLYHYGGVYMDMDISCRWSLHPLLQYPAWFPEALPLGINNDLMAARARHPILMQMIMALEARNRNLIFPYLTIYWSTGPQFTSDILKKYFLEQKSDFNAGTPRSRRTSLIRHLPNVQATDKNRSQRLHDASPRVLLRTIHLLWTPTRRILARKRRRRRALVRRTSSSVLGNHLHGIWCLCGVLSSTI